MPGMKHDLSIGLHAAAVLFLALVLPARAGGGPYNTLFVANANSRDSRQLAAHYARVHGLPEANVCMIHADPHKPSIPLADFETSIRQPILDHIARNGLAGQIHFLVLGMDIPTRVNYFNSITAALFYGYKPKPPDAPQCNIAPDSVNQYYAAERAYSSAAGWNATNMPIVFALTAPDLKTAKAVVDRAAESLRTPCSACTAPATPPATSATAPTPAPPPPSPGAATPPPSTCASLPRCPPTVPSPCTWAASPTSPPTFPAPSASHRGP